MFYFLWFSDIIPAISKNSIPASVSDYNLLVNPVHVMDLSFILPGLIITSVLLIKGRPMGFVLAPILLIFTVLMSLALVAMAVALNIKDVSSDFSLVVIFCVLAIFSIIYLIVFFKRMKVRLPDQKC